MQPATPCFETIHARIDENPLDGGGVTSAGCAILPADADIEHVLRALCPQVARKRWKQERVIWHWRALALVAGEQVDAHWLALTPGAVGAGNQIAGMLNAARISFADCGDAALDLGSAPVLKWCPSGAVVRLWPRGVEALPEDTVLDAGGIRLLHRVAQVRWDDRSKPRPAYFTALTLDHVRCFGSEQHVKFTDPASRPAAWTLLLGENGVGKTTILQCLAWMRPQVRVDKKGKEVGIQGAISDWENADLLGLAREGSSGSYSLECHLAAQAALGVDPGTDIHTSATVSFTDRDLSEAGTNLESGSRGPCPDVPLIYYGAGRFVGSKNLGEPRLKDAIGSVAHGRTEMYDPEEVLRDFDAEAAKASGAGGRRAQALLRRILWLLVDLLPDVERPDDIQIARPGVSGPAGGPAGIRFRTPYGTVSLEDLSFGYRTTLTWALDLCMRLVRLHEHHPDPLGAAAVVLVDEIDLHLHPRWQRDIRENLLRVFPAVQFIVTAHSPIMAQDAESANIEVVRQQDGEVRVISSPHLQPGARLDQILTGELFELPARSKATAALIERRRYLHSLPSVSPDELQERERLDVEFAALPHMELAGDQRLMDILRLAASTVTPAPRTSG
jgi:hypothetical protein